MFWFYMFSVEIKLDLIKKQNFSWRLVCEKHASHCRHFPPRNQIISTSKPRKMRCIRVSITFSKVFHKGLRSFQTETPLCCRGYHLLLFRLLQLTPLWLTSGKNHENVSLNPIGWHSMVVSAPPITASVSFKNHVTMDTVGSSKLIIKYTRGVVKSKHVRSSSVYESRERRANLSLILFMLSNNQTHRRSDLTNWEEMGR